MDGLIFLDIDLDDLAGNAGADLVQIPINLRIVRVLGKGGAPVEEAGDDGEQKHDGNDDETPAGFFCGWFRRRWCSIAGGSGLLRVAAVAFDDQAVGAGFFGAFDDGDVDLSVAGGVELVKVGLPVTGGVGHPHIGFAVTVGVGAEDDMVFVDLGLIVPSGKYPSSLVNVIPFKNCTSNDHFLRCGKFYWAKSIIVAKRYLYTAYKTLLCPLAH